jgi:catechol 2,3-dioxygenase-like lactoylglutathione lyase family enzyme
MQDFYSYGIDHLNLGVANAERARDFYVAALKPLGIELTLSIPPEAAEPGGDQEGLGQWMFGHCQRKQPKPSLMLPALLRLGTGSAFLG